MKDTHLRVVVNANPSGKKAVDQGDFCKRSNDKNVDLNRNWDFMWGRESLGYDNTFGSKAFSEIETVFLKHLVAEFSPKVFLTLHSGLNALFMPYAYADVECTRNYNEMMAVLTEIQAKHCPYCKKGLPSRALKYNSNGTCLDYIYDKLQVPYSFGWEIYDKEDSPVEQSSFLEMKSKIVLV